MMHVRRQFCLAIALSLFPAASLFAEEAPGGIDPSLIVEQFDVFTDGDDLLVPVEIGAKTYLCCVDTGCTVSVYDESLRPLLGEARESKEVTAPSGAIRIDFYNSPNARLGKLRLRAGAPVGCFDFQKLREIAGYDFYGIIGMDMLGDHIVRLDSDRGKLMILRSPGTAVGEVLPLIYSAQLPRVAIDIPSCGKLLFTIDTGFTGRNSGTIDASSFEHSAVKGFANQVATTLFADAAGVTTVRQVRLEHAFAGDFECRNLVMDQFQEQRRLSLRFMTRFNVTFDFREDRLYLEKSQHFDRPDRFDLSGLHFLRRKGRVVIETVDEGSPAALGGCKPGDIILNLNGQDASKVRLYTMRETLSLPGTTAYLKVRQGNEVIDVELSLPKTERLADAREGK